MKNVIALILSISVLFTISACSKSETLSMSIKPSEFSEETSKVLELFNDELHFFDLKTDETVKHYAVSVWLYRDGEWHGEKILFGEVDLLPEQIAIEIRDDNYTFFSITENGHTSAYYPEIGTDFTSSVGISNLKIETEFPVELNQEIPIFIKYGMETNSIKIFDITKDFRNIECDAGIAFTLTVSDIPIE